MSKLNLLISEILIAHLIGSMPLLIVVKSNPSADVVETLAALNPSDPVVIYFFYLLFLHLFIWFVNKFILKTKEHVSSFFRAAHRFSHQIGFAIHSVYRVIAGSIPTAIGLHIYEHGFDRSTFIVSVASSFLVFGSLFMCCVLTWLNYKTGPKQNWL